MTCAPKKCGQVKTDFGPLGPVTVTRTDGPLAGSTVLFADVVAEATRLLQNAVDAEKKTEPDPDLPACDEGCGCAGLVWTPRPPDSVPFTVNFTVNGVPYSGTTKVNRTLSDGVGRCAPQEYKVAMARVPELGMTLALAREHPITQAELAQIERILGGGGHVS